MSEGNQVLDAGHRIETETYTVEELRELCLLADATRKLALEQKFKLNNEQIDNIIDSVFSI